ncbi:hypothetical protein BRD06_10090 [Halobacteriales archaeon QS_9_67_15]|nr:MAG: hypothetical protein BRD06_10090 [Halobacteriales archaeon QS_9_67_15]
MPVGPGTAAIILVSMLGATGMAVIAFVGGLEPPYGRATTFLFTPLGFVSAYATDTGRISADADRASALTGAVSAGVVGIYPTALDVASLL